MDSGADEMSYNFEKLKTFHIPRKKEQQDKKGLLSELSIQSREFTHTLYPAIKSSFFYPTSSRKLRIEKVDLVNNAGLQKEFQEKRKSLKDEGRTEKDLAECYGFIFCSDKQQVEKLCQNGLEIGNAGLVSLGKHTMGVYVCKHADIVSPANFVSNDQGYIVVFKIIKGKTKLVSECRDMTTSREPTPLYDCHITKLNMDQSKIGHIRAFQALQYYVYEYGDVDIVKRPRQVTPYAVLQVRYNDKEAAPMIRKESSSCETSLDSSQRGVTAGPATNPLFSLKTFLLWKGKLLVKGGVSCSVKLLTDVDTSNTAAFLEKHLNVKATICADKFSRQLPPTLLNKSTKKHNVIYRNRHYNVFALFPADDSGVGKFRQLIGCLVQRNAVAVIPLRWSSCVYLLPNSGLTVNRMGLLPPEPDADSAKKNEYLHAIIVTPKVLLSKVNDQKIYNVLRARKPKDLPEKLTEEMLQKLQVMNVEIGAAVGSMQTEELKKLCERLPDKKKPQLPEKLLHQHYRDIELVLVSSEMQNRFAGRIGAAWSQTCQARIEYYTPKPKFKKSIAKPRISSEEKAPIEMEQEATFSDDDVTDGDLQTKPQPVVAGSDPRGQKRRQQAPTPRAPKRSLSAEATDREAPPAAKIVRPSFKALEEVICRAHADAELMLHPDFVFSERFKKTHTITKERGFGTTLDVEREHQMSATISQKVPFSNEKDCPYACDGDPIVKSMLRAVHGAWKVEPGDGHEEDQKKVFWVRETLLKHKTQSHKSGSSTIFSDSTEGRKIVEEGTMAPLRDASPSSAPGGNSSDSGCASSSTVTTPTNPNQASSSPNAAIRDIANKFASVMDNQPGDVESALQNFIQAVADGKVELNDDLKSIMHDIKSSTGTTGSKTDHQNCGEESSSPPAAVTTRSPLSEQDKAASGPTSDGNDLATRQSSSVSVSGQPQDPRLTRSVHSHRRLNLPSYRFPPSQKSLQALPKDAEAAQGQWSKSLAQSLRPTTTTRPVSAVKVRLASLPADTKSSVETSHQDSPPLTSQPITSLLDMRSRAKGSETETTTGELHDASRSQVGETTAGNLPGPMSGAETTRAAMAARRAPEGGSTEGQARLSTATDSPWTRSSWKEDAPNTRTRKSPIPLESYIRRHTGGRNTRIIGESSHVTGNPTSHGAAELLNRILREKTDGKAAEAGGLAKEIAYSILRQLGWNLPSQAQQHIPRLPPDHTSNLLKMARRPKANVAPRRFIEAPGEALYSGAEPDTSSNNNSKNILASSAAADIFIKKAPTFTGTFLHGASHDMVTGVGDTSSKENLSIVLSNTLCDSHSTQSPSRKTTTAISARVVTRITQSTNATGQDTSDQKEITTCVPAVKARSGEKAGPVDSLEDIVSTSSRSPTPTSSVSPQVATSPSSSVLSPAVIQRLREKHQQKRAEEKQKKRKLRKLRLKDATKSSDGQEKERKIAAAPEARNPGEDPRPGSGISDPKPDSSVSDPNPGSSVSYPKPGSSVSYPKPGSSVSDPKPGNDISDPKPGSSVSDAKSGTRERIPVDTDKTEVDAPRQIDVDQPSEESKLPEPICDSPVNEEKSKTVGGSGVLSEIDQILVQVRDEPKAGESAEVLSNRLLELALQLRNAPSSPVPSTSNASSTAKTMSTAVAASIFSTSSPDIDVTTSVSVASSSAKMPGQTDAPQQDQVPLNTDSMGSVMMQTGQSFGLPPEVYLPSLPNAISSSSVAPTSSIPYPAAVDDAPMITTHAGAAMATHVTPAYPFPHLPGALIQPHVEGVLPYAGHPTFTGHAAAGLNLPVLPPVPTVQHPMFAHSSEGFFHTGQDATVIHPDVQRATQALQAAAPPYFPAAQQPTLVWDYTRNTGTPTLDDTYNADEESAIQASQERSYLKISPLSRHSKPILDPSRATAIAFRHITGEICHPDYASPGAYNRVIIAPLHEPLLNRAFETNENNSPPTAQPRFVQSETQRISDQENIAPAAAVPNVPQRPPYPQDSKGDPAPAFYVFDPRGHSDCTAIEEYLRGIGGVPFDLHHVTDVLSKLVAPDDSDKENQSMPINSSILNRSLPEGHLWIVIRSTDRELLPSLPYLALLKCCGPRVQFVSTNTLSDVRTGRYSNIMSGENGIVLPVSADVIINSYMVFARLIEWMAELKQHTDGVDERHSNIWRLAVYKEVLAEMRALSRDDEAADAWRRSRSHYLVQAIENNRDVLVDLPATKSSSGTVNARDVVETAIRLQLENCHSTRHVVVLTEYDQLLDEWKTLRRAGVAVTTVTQFMHAVWQGKSKGSRSRPNNYSPLMKIYRTEIS